MVGIELSHEERIVVRNLKQQGILDHHFDQVLEIRSADNYRFVLEVISMFLNDSESCLAEMNRLLNEDIVDFGHVVSYCHQLRGSSASIGGRQVAIASRELRLLADEMDKDRCLEALDKLKSEYQILKNSFNIIVQIERNMVANSTRRRSTQP